MTNTQKIIIFFLIIGIIFFCCLVGISAYKLWQKPLGPSLELPTSTYAPLATLPLTRTPFAEQNPPPAYPATGTPAPTATSTPTPASALCGGPDEMIILAIGSDQRGDLYNYGLADVIRLVRIDFIKPQVMIMSLPRDLYVEIPDISDHHGTTHGKLNQPYFYGNPGMGYYDGPGEGPGLMARTLAHNFGAQPDNYIAVNMQTFIKIVNAVDGINVDLPITIDGRAADQVGRDDLIFYAGKHHLYGKEALQLARLRPYGIFDRAKAQNEVLCGLYDKLTSPSVVGDIPGIISSFEDNVQTDLSPEQISQLTCLGTQLTGSDIRLLNWDEGIFTGTRLYDTTGAQLGTGTSIWDVDFALMREYIAAFERGEWLGDASTAPAAPVDYPNKSFCD